jgi:hypothetical protein
MVFFFVLLYVIFQSCECFSACNTYTRSIMTNFKIYNIICNEQVFKHWLVDSAILFAIRASYDPLFLLLHEVLLS